MEYKKLTEDNLDFVVRHYMDYYNNQENGCWTCQTAHARIHPIMTMEGAECLLLFDNGELIGFLMGYYKQFDDLKVYFLEEIVIFSAFQNKGYGSCLMIELEKIVKRNGASYIKLMSVNDECHEHFYGKLGYASASHLSIKEKHIE